MHLQDVAKVALPSPQFQRELLRFWSIRPVPASIPPEPAASAGLRQRAATHEREKFEQPIQRRRAIDPLPATRQKARIGEWSPTRAPRRNLGDFRDSARPPRKGARHTEQLQYRRVPRATRGHLS